MWVTHGDSSPPVAKAFLCSWGPGGRSKLLSEFLALDGLQLLRYSGTSRWVVAGGCPWSLHGPSSVISHLLSDQVTVNLDSGGACEGAGGRGQGLTAVYAWGWDPGCGQDGGRGSGLQDAGVPLWGPRLEPLEGGIKLLWQGQGALSTPCVLGDGPGDAGGERWGAAATLVAVLPPRTT